jgi:hypothetical protein
MASAGFCISYRCYPGGYAAPAIGAIIHASNVFDDAVASLVPDVHAEGEVRLGLHGQA